jgi:alpha-glucoside transport system substrate-binding protein
VVDHAASGAAVSLEDLGFDLAELEATFGEYFLSLGSSRASTTGCPPTST